MSSTPSRTSLFSVYVGNLFEHYDTALFGFLSPFLAPLIFPQEDPLTALILTYAIIPLGMVIKPIGSLVFGYIGDRYGRKYSLWLTLGGMSFVSGCIALCPTYAQVGILAPLFFCIGRICQNFFAAGEVIGGAIFLLENTPQKQKDLFSALYDTSTIGGILLASSAVCLLDACHMLSSGWRALYALGCVMSFFGFIVRKSDEPPPKPTQIHLKNALWTYRKPFLAIVLCSGFSYATASLALVLMNGLIPLVSPFSKGEIMRLNTSLLLLDLCALPFFGWVASKIGRAKLMLASSLATALLSLPLFIALEGSSFEMIVAIRMALILLGVSFFAPFHAWAQELLPASCRYSILSLGYAIGSQLLGSPTAAFSLWCFQKTGSISSIGWYWTALSLASALAIQTQMKQEKAGEAL